MPAIYNFAMQQMVSDVDLDHLTDLEAVRLIPQHPVVQSLYVLLRWQGLSAVEAIIDILKVQLMSGGQKKIIPTSGRESSS